MKTIHFHTFVCSLVFRFKFFHGISLEIRARSDAGPGLIYSALPKIGKAKVADYQVFPLNGKNYSLCIIFLSFLKILLFYRK